MTNLVLNEIKTDAGYLADGFTAEEIPMVRRSDELFNQWQANGFLKERKQKEYFELTRRLGI